MNNIILIILSYISVFLLGRLLGFYETRKIVEKILNKECLEHKKMTNNHGSN